MPAVANLSPIDIAPFRQDRIQSLLKRAEWAQVTIEPDYVRADSFIAREPAHRGYCNVVPVDGCTCPEFGGWEECPHHALLIHLLNTESVSVLTATA